MKVIKGTDDSRCHLYFGPTAAAQYFLAFAVFALVLPNMREVQYIF